MIKKTLLTVCVLTLPQGAFALTLQQALMRALQQNQQVQAAKEDVKVQEERQRQAFGKFLPYVTAEASAGWTRSEADEGVSQDYNARNYSLTASQDIYTSGKNKSAYDASRHTALAEQAAMEGVVQDVLLETAERYMDLLVAQEALIQQQNLQEVYRQQLESVRVRFETGDVTRTDVAQSEAALANARADALAAERDVLVAKVALERALGEQGTMPEEELIWPQTPMGVVLHVDTVQEDVLAQHPSILEYLHTLTAETYDITNAKAQRLPDLTANASISRDEDLAGVDKTTENLTFTVSIPLYTGGINNSGVREAIAARAGAQARYEDVRQSVREELLAASYAHRIALSRMAALEQSLKATELATHGVRREQELGQRSILDVLEAEQDLLDAKVAHIEARAEAITTAYRLLAALGRLKEIPDEGEMDQPNSTLAETPVSMTEEPEAPPPVEEVKE